MGFREEIVVVLSSAIALGLTSRVVTNGIDKLWEAQLLFYQLAELGAIPFGGNRDIPVLLLLGVLFGWFILFMTDGTKRIQALIVVTVGSVSVGTRLIETGRIVEAIGRSPEAMVIGTLIGLATGLATASLYGVKRGKSMGILQKLSWIQFSPTVGAFRSSMALIVLISAIDNARMSDTLASIEFGVMSLILVISLSVFLQYDIQRDVVAISPPDENYDYKYHPYVLGGLYHRAKNDYHGFSTDGRHLIAQASEATSFEGLLSEFEQRVGFGFISGLQANWTDGIRAFGANLLPRTVRIVSNETTTEDLPEIGSNDQRNKYILLMALALRRMGRHLITLIPQRIRSQVATSGQQRQDLDSADTILLIGPTLAGNDVPPEGVGKFNDICARYKTDPTTDVVVATTEAQKSSKTKEEMQIRTRENLGIEDEYLSWTDVYPLPWYREALDDSERIPADDEYSKLLERLGQR